MFDLAWDQISHEISYRKSGKMYPMKVTMGVIPSEKLVRYDRSLQRPIKQDKDGGTTMDMSPSDMEEALFNEYFRALHISGKLTPGTPEEVLKKIPVEVKRATIREGVGGVFPVEEEKGEEGTLDSILELDNSISITARANGQEHVLTHHLKEPLAEHELAYRKATAGSLKTLPGRKRTEFMVVEDFNVYGKLYDALVERVEGYCENGAPFDPLHISQIPYIHKKVVIKQLFGAASIQEVEEGQGF